MEKEIQNQIMREFATRPDIRLMRQNVGMAVPYQVVKIALGYLNRGDVDGCKRILINARPVQFGVKGQADLTGIIKGGRRLEIEVKSATGVQSREQKNYEKMINKFGGLYILARGIDDVEKKIKQ